METGAKMDVAKRLNDFREMGVVNHTKTLSLSHGERIPQLIQQENGRARVSAAIMGSLFSAFQNLNIKNPMNEEQIFELAEAIIDQSHEDYLSIEDVLLFLRDLITGKCGKVTERMDMPTFFEYMEKYRQKRWEALCAIRDEQHTQSKATGRIPRRGDAIELKRDEDPQAVLSLMQSFYQKDDDVD
jgi:hypothetical protein